MKTPIKLGCVSGLIEPMLWTTRQSVALFQTCHDQQLREDLEQAEGYVSASVMTGEVPNGRSIPTLF